MRTRLKLWRLRRGLTMRQLSDKSHVGTPTIVKIEKHGHIPQGDTLLKLAQALEVSTEELLTEDNEKPLVLAR